MYFFFHSIENLALALIPAGLNAVAIFPPFATPRTPGIDAEAAIFKEAPTSFVARRRSYRKPSLKDRFLKNVRCLIPRLKEKFGRKSNAVSSYNGYGKGAFKNYVDRRRWVGG